MSYKNILLCGSIISGTNGDKDLNKGFYKDLDTNFEQALILSEKNFSHSELIELLKTENIPQKQAAALNFDYVKETNDAQILLSNLTGCDGKIREAVALAINRILTDDINSRRIFSPVSAEIFADATIDINANICRLVVDSAILLRDFDDFSESYTNKIISYTKQALDELDKFIFRDKKYVINKQLFKLYWCLEGLNYFYDRADKDELKTILIKCAKQKEYTVREKAAQIAVQNDYFSEIADLLKNDENYYVRHILYKNK